MFKQLLSGRFLLRLFKDSFAEWSKDNAMRLSAALSYYSVFSIAPLIMIAIGIAGWFYGPAADQGSVEKHLGPLVGWQAAAAINSLVSSAGKSSSGATIVGFITLFIGAATVFGQLKDALDTIWEVRTKPGLGIWNMIRERLLTFSMVLVIGFLLLVSLVGAATLTALGGFLERYIGLPTSLNAVLIFFSALIVETVLFALIFKVLPNVIIEWRCVIVGAVFTALLFELGKFGLSQYLARPSATSPFGAAGSVVLVLLWVYYASCILFFGANITEVYARHTGHTIQPGPNAESTELTCSGGSAGSASQAPAAVSAEPHPLTPAIVPPKTPLRESLVPLLRDAHAYGGAVSGPRIPPSTFTDRAKAGFDALHERPVAQIGAAVGVGLVIGIVSRALDRKAPAVSAQEHLKLGLRSAAGQASNAAKEATATALQKVLRNL